MDLKIYEKTRYQNIYRHKKNKNYIVMMSKPVKTSIASVNGKKLLRVEDAIKIRDDYKIKAQKATEATQIGTFDDLWTNYIDWSKNIDKQAYNTYHKKEKIYNKYFKYKFGKVAKITKEEMANFINKLDCSTKQKNEILRIVKPFFNWCINKEILISNPVVGIKLFKVEKPKMKFLTPKQFNNLLDVINFDIENNINKETAYRTKIFVLTGFVLGDRVGETRVLRFDSINEDTETITISNSINYDPNSDSHLSSTKTKSSDRQITVSKKYIDEIKKYKWHLINEFDYDIMDNELIFCNHITKQPVSDVTLRKYFYKYLEKANLPKIRMYDLRHTYVATMMAEGKELYHISERLGHTNYSTTVNKYGHLSNQVRKEIAETTDKYF